MSRFFGTKGPGVVFVRFSNSPITRIKGRPSCGGVPQALSPPAGEALVGTPHEPRRIDLAIGSRLCALRHRHGLSRQDLAHKLGTAPHMIQYHEEGSIRVRASRLWQLAQIFGVSMAYFFEDTVGD